MKKGIYFRFARYIITIIFIFSILFSFGQIKRITSNTKTSHQAFCVGHVNGTQKDSLVSISAIIIPRSALKNSSGKYLKGVLDSISFYMAEGCGYSTYNSTFKIYAKETNDGTISSNIFDYTKYIKTSQLIFYSDETKFPDIKNNLTFTTNHAFEYKDSGNIIILTQWIRPRVSSCYNTKWYGDFVTDNSVMSWENSAGNFSATKDARFKFDIGLSFNPNLTVCGTKSSFRLYIINSDGFGLSVDSNANPIDIGVKRSALLRFIPSFSKRVSDSISVQGLVPATQYFIHSKDTCVPTNYVGFNYLQEFKTGCIYSNLENEPYFQNFDGKEGSEQTFPCWTFQNPNYKVENTSFSNSGNKVIRLLQNSNHSATSMGFKMKQNVTYEISFKYAVFGTFNNLHIIVSASQNPNDAGVFSDSLKNFFNNYYLNRTISFKPNADNIYYVHFILKNPITTGISLYIDDVHVRKANNCLMPVIDTFMYYDNFAVAKYKLQGNVVGLQTEFSDGMNSLIYSTNKSSDTFKNLKPNTNYTLSYKAKCSDSTYSNVGIKKIFKTRCKIDTIADYRKRILHQYEAWECLDGIPNSQGPLPGVTGNGMLVYYEDKIIEGSTVYLAQNDSFTIEVFHNPYYTSDTTSPRLVYFTDNDSSNRRILPVTSQTVSYTNFKKISASFRTNKSGIYTIGVSVIKGQNPILDNLSIHKAIVCNSIKDVKPVSNVTEHSADIKWALKDTGSTKTLIKLFDNYSNTILFTSMGTEITMTGLIANHEYSVEMFVICGTDTGNAVYPFKFKTRCFVDTIHKNSSVLNDFESPSDFNCFLTSGKDFEHHFGKTAYTFDQPVSGNGYLYSLRNFSANLTDGSNLLTNRLFLFEGIPYTVKYDYIKYKGNTSSIIEVVNENDSIIHSEIFGHSAEQLSGNITSRFYAYKSGIYRIRLRMEYRFSIDNLSITAESCDKIKPTEQSHSQLSDSLRIDFTLSNKEAESIQIDINTDKPNQWEWTIPVVKEKASLTFSTKEAKIYTINTRKNCTNVVSSVLTTNLLSSLRTIDSISTNKSWETTFDTQSKLDSYIFGNLPNLNAADNGFPNVSGLRYLQIPIDLADTLLPIHYLDSGLVYSFRFLANSNLSTQRNLSLIVISDDFTDTLVNLTKSIGSTLYYKEIFYEFRCLKPGGYFVRLVAPKNIKPIYIENFTYKGYHAYRTNNITSIIQASDSTVNVKWSEIKDPNIKHCVINLFPYEEVHLAPIISDTLLFSDTSYVLRKFLSDHEYSVQLQFLDGSKRPYCRPDIALFVSKAEVDTLQFIGDVYTEDFENSKAFGFVPNGGSNHAASKAFTVPNPSYSNFTTSGINAYQSTFINREIYLFKDSVYLLSVNAMNTSKTVGAAIEFRNDSTKIGASQSVDQEFKTYFQRIVPANSGTYKYGFATSNGSILYDDFRITRIDTFAKEYPILKRDSSGENWIALSWNRANAFKHYILERAVDNTIAQDTFKNKFTQRTFYTNLPLEKKYNFKLFFDDSNINSGPLRFLTGHIPDTIKFDNQYLEDYEKSDYLRRLLQFRMNTDFYRTTTNKISGQYSMTFDYQSGKSNYNTVLAKVYLEVNKNYIFSGDFRSVGANNVTIYMNSKNSLTGATNLNSQNITNSIKNISVSVKPSVSGVYYFMVNIVSSFNKVYVDNILVKEQVDCVNSGTTKITITSDSIKNGHARILVSNSTDAKFGIEYTLQEKKYNSSKWVTNYTFTKPISDTIFKLYNLLYSSNYAISAKAICQPNNLSAASNAHFINLFCKDSIFDIDSNNSYTENFEGCSEIPDCWIFNLSNLTYKLSNDLLNYSHALAFTDNQSTHAISKKFNLKSSTSYLLKFDYYLLVDKDTIFYDLYDASKDTIFKSGYVSSQKFNSHSLVFTASHSGPFYIRFWKKLTLYSAGHVDNLSISVNNGCNTDKLTLSSNEQNAIGNIKVGTNTVKNLIEVINTLNWKIDTFSIPATQSAFTYNYKSEMVHLFKITSVCNSDTGSTNMYKATREFPSINVENGWCENFARLPENDMQPGWSATGGRTVYMNPYIKIGECLGITNNPLTDDHEKGYWAYGNSRRVYYIQSPKINFDINKRYNLSALYYFSHGAYQCCNWWYDRGIDTIFAELYDETTNYKLKIGSDFALNGDNIQRTKSIDFTVPYSGKFKIRIYVHIAHGKSGNPVNFILDDFCLKPISGCNAPPVAKLTYDTLTKTNVLSWSKLSSAKSGYQWYMTTAESNQIIFRGATPTAFDTSQVLFDIDEGLIYKIFVRSDCTEPITDSAFNSKVIQEAIMSDWSQAFALSTECLDELPDVNDVLFDFEQNVGYVPNCWVNYNNNWSTKTPFEEFRAQNSKSFLFLQKSNYDSISTKSVILTKDTAYVVKIGLLTDGRKGVNSVSGWLVDDLGKQFFLGDFEQNSISTTYIDRYLDFKAPHSGVFRVKIVVRMTSNSGSGPRGLAFDNIAIRKTMPCRRPKMLSHDGLNKEKIVLSLDSTTIGKDVIVQYKLAVDSFKYNTFSVVGKRIEIDRKKDLSNAWSVTSISNKCGSENEFSSEFVIPPMRFDSIRIKLGTPYFEDFNSEIEPLSAVYGWDYYMPTDYSIEKRDMYFETPEIKVYDKGYLRLNGRNTTPFPQTSYIGTPWLDLDAYETYSLEFRLKAEWGPGIGYGIVNQLGDTTWLHPTSYYSSNWDLLLDTFRVKSYGLHRLIFSPNIAFFTLGIDNLKITLNNPKCIGRPQASLLSTNEEDIVFELFNSTGSSPFRWKIVKDVADHRAQGLYSGYGKAGDTIRINNLPSKARYYGFTQGVCKAGDTSQWTPSFQFVINCDKDSLKLNTSACDNFEDLASVACYINNTWGVSSIPIKGLNTSNGKTYLYKDETKNANLLSGYFLAKRDESLDVSMLLFTDSVYGLEKFSVNLINLDSSKTTKGYEFKDTVFAVKNYKTIPLRIPSDGLYRISFDGLPKNKGFILLDDICITKTDRCLAPQLLSVESNTETARLNINKPNYTDSVFIDVWNINREDTSYLRSEYHSIISASILLQNLQPDQKYKIIARGFCSGALSIDSSTYLFKTNCRVDTIRNKTIFSEGFEKIWMDWSTGCNVVSNKTIWEIDTTYGGYNSQTSLSKYAGTAPFFSKKMHLVAKRQYEVSLNQRVNGFGFVQEMTYGLVKDDSTFTQIATKKITGPTNTSFERNSFIFTNDSNVDARFFIGTKGGHYVYFDDLSVHEFSPCLPISDIKIDSAFNFGAQVSWKNPQYPVSNLEFVVKDQESWTPQNLDTSFYNSNVFAFNGLFPGRTYVLYSRSYCQSGDTSNFTDTLSFVPVCPVYTISQFNQMGTLDRNDSNRYCWTLKNSVADNLYHWSFTDSIFKEGVLLKDLDDQSGTQYLSAKGSKNGKNITSSVSTPLVALNVNRKLLEFKVSNNKPLNVGDEPKEHNRLSVIIEDTLLRIKDTVFVFNGTLPNIWTHFSIEIPDEYQHAFFQFNYLQDADSNHLHALAIDGIKIRNGYCHDLYKAELLTNNSNNSLCLALDSNLYIGHENALSYVVHLQSLNGISLNHLDASYDVTAYNLSDSFSINQSNYFVTSAYVFGKGKNDRLSFADSLKIAFSKTAFNVLADSILTGSSGQRILKSEDLVLFSTSEQKGADARLIGQINRNNLDSITFGKSVKNGTFTLNSSYNNYLLNIQPDDLQNWLTITAYGRLKGGHISYPSFNKLFINPNPFSDQIAIYSESAFIDDYQLTDIRGRIVSGENNLLKITHLKIFTKDLVPGVYTLSIKSNTKTYNYKLIKF